MLALPNFFKTKERTLDKEATANLKLIQAAEKIYRMETNTYYNSVSFNNALINQNLKLSLPTGVSVNWVYYTDPTGTAITNRNPSPTRSWYLTISATDPTCSGACY